MNRNIAVLIWSAVTGLLLCCFSLIPSFWRYAFSLSVFFVGLRFLGQYETWGIRIVYILLSIVFFFLFVTLYIAIAHMNGWPVPEPNAA